MPSNEKSAPVKEEQLELFEAPDPGSAPKRGETVSGTVYLATDALAVTSSHDEEAEESFRGLYGSKKLDNVTITAKEHAIGTGISYTFTGVVK